MNGTELTNQILEYLEKIGFLIWKKNMKDALLAFNNDPGFFSMRVAWKQYNGGKYSKPGILDIQGFDYGRYLTIEVKGRGDVLRFEQELMIALVKQSGGIAFEARSLDDVVRRIK